MINPMFPLDEQYVLFFDDELAACILHYRNTGKAFDSVHDMAGSDEINDPDAYEDLMGYLEDIGLGDRYHGFTGTVSTAQLDRRHLPDVLHFENDAIAFLSPVGHNNIFCGPVYKNPGKLVAEYRNRMSFYIPKDFDIKSRICHIYGVYDY